jgi:hypothetical protein
MKNKQNNLQIKDELEKKKDGSNLKAPPPSPKIKPISAEKIIQSIELQIQLGSASL